MNDKKIVITGGAGFIGSNLARELLKQNTVSIIDDLSTGTLDNISDLIDSNKISFIKGSITDLELVQESLKGANYVFHQAAIPSVPRSIEDPLSSNYANVNGSLNVLLAARDNQVKKLVSASSSSIYGDTPTLPKIEDMKSKPLSPYAIGKLTAEYYSQVFHDLYQLKTVSLRYFNVYGPYQDPLSEYAAVIPRFITRLLDNKPPVIYGDGGQTRDFTYIKDVVRANIMAAESDCAGIYNIAGGKQITLNDLASTLMNIIGTHIDPIYEDYRPGDIKHSLAEVSKARIDFGFTVEYDIQTGLKETVSWFQK